MEFAGLVVVSWNLLTSVLDASQLCKLESMELVGILPDIRIKCHLIHSHSNTGALSEAYVV